MKRFCLFLAASLTVVLMTACEQDNITTTTDSGSITVEEGVVDTTCSVLGEYDHKVVVVYSTSGTATITGTDDSITAKISGCGVTITNNSSRKVMYILTGTSNNGYFKVYSGRKQGLQLNNLGLVNPKGAAINIQGTVNTPSAGKQADIYLGGSTTLGDGGNYSLTPDNEDEKAVIFSEGQIVLHGNGTLNISAVGKSCITSDDWVAFYSGCTVNATSKAGHGIRGKNYILIGGGTLNVETSANMKKGLTSDSLVRFDGGQTTITVTGNAAYDSEDNEYTGTAGVKADVSFVMNDGSLSITNSGTGGKGISCDGTGTFNGGTVDITVTGSNYTSGDISSKGIKCDGNIIFDGSTVNVKCSKHEGIESKGTITMNSGTVYSYSQGDDAINSASSFTINGGFLCGHSTANDGLDANGNFYVKGGLVYAICKGSPEVALDANTEGGYKLYVEGGTLIAIGGLENNASLTQKCYQAGSWSKNTWYSLTVGNSVYAFMTPSSGGSPLVVSGESTPSLKSGVTTSGGVAYFNNTLLTDVVFSGGSEVSLSSYTGGGGGHGPGGGRR